MNQSLFNKKLNTLVENNLIYQFNNYYSVSKNIQTLVKNRKLSNSLAQEKLPLARLQATLIAKFPFVKAVCLSGTIFKKCYGARWRFRLFYYYRKK